VMGDERAPTVPCARCRLGESGRLSARHGRCRKYILGDHQKWHSEALSTPYDCTPIVLEGRFCDLGPEYLLCQPYNGPMLGDTVHQARCAKGWSIPQLSKRSGVPERLIRELEGRSVTYVPSEANTVRLAEALKVPAGPLLEQRERLFEQWHRRDVVG
jgi:hypothetical protein